MNRIDGSTVRDLVARLANVAVIGNADVFCHDALPLCDATAGCVTLMDDRAPVVDVIRCGAAAVVTNQAHADFPATQIVAADIHTVFTAIVRRFRHSLQVEQYAAIDASAQIAPTASIGIGTRIDANVCIGAHVVIGSDCHLMPGTVVMDGTVIGDRCKLYPRVVIYEYSKLDDEIQIHAGSVIGAHGFGYRNVDGKHVLSAQLGYVHIESNVDVGANVTIDRGTYGVTRIGEGTKIDNLVMIAHNCHIGRHNLICSQVGLAGSCRTGDYVVIAGQVGMADHISIGDRAVVGAQAGVMENVPSGQTYLGSPATLQREQMQIFAVQRRLPEMRREVKSLRRELDELKSQGDVETESDPNGSTQRASSGGPAADDENPHCLKFRRSAA